MGSNVGDQINTEIITGNLGRSPEIKTFDSGKRKASLRVAVYCGGSGDDKRTLWIDATYWADEGADLVMDVLALMETGERVIIHGRPDVEKWKGRDGDDKERRVLNAWAIMRAPRSQPAERTEPESGYSGARTSSSEPVGDDDDPGPSW